MKKLLLLILCCIFVSSCYSKDETIVQEIPQIKTVDKIDTNYMSSDFKKYIDEHYYKILAMKQGDERMKASVDLSYTIANSIKRKPNTVYIFNTEYIENQTSKTWLVKDNDLQKAVKNLIYNGSKILTIFQDKDGKFEIEVDF